MSPKSPIRLAVLAAAVASIAACSEPNSAVIAAKVGRLRAQFPKQSSEVLGGTGLAATADGFAVPAELPADPVRAAEESLRRRHLLTATFPKDARGEIRFASDGFEARVIEVGARGEGELVEKAVAYRRKNGASYWSAQPDRFEEWLLIDADPEARGEQEVAAWEIAGASLRQSGEKVELLDRAGVAKVRVSAPHAYEASGREVRARLQAQDGRLALFVEAHQGEVLVDPAWAFLTAMSTVRYQHSATLLPNGKVLVAGGLTVNDSIPTASCELFDPIARTWSATGSLATARAAHTAVLLPATGRVLVAGGGTATAEWYDPTAGTWSNLWAMSSMRSFATATVLTDGRVLVAGGISNVYPPFPTAPTTPLVLATTEILAVNGTWSAGPALATARMRHTATLLPNGNVLVVGGANGTGTALASAELVSYTAPTWTVSPAGNLTTMRVGHTATLATDGKVYVIGGFPGLTTWPATLNIEAYTPGTGTGTGAWTGAGALGQQRAFHSASLLPSGLVLVAGGFNGGTIYLNSTEIYDPSTKGVPGGTPMPNSRSDHTATVLPSGAVLFTGGMTATGVTGAADLYDPAAPSHSVTNVLLAARTHHTATVLGTGKVLVAGGKSGASTTATAELYDPTAGTYAATGSMVGARQNQTATLLPNGKVLVTGGDDWVVNILGTAELYDPAAAIFSATASLSVTRTGHTATLLPNGKVLVAGGLSTASWIPLTSAELYDPVAGTWSPTGSMATARGFHTATLLPNGKVLVVGGRSGATGNAVTGTAELYDPSLGTWSAAGVLTYPRTQHTATLLPQGNVLIAGGWDFGNALDPASYRPHWEIYHPSGGTWSVNFNGPVGYGHSATLLPGGKVVWINGIASTAAGLQNTQAQVMLYDPWADKWTNASIYLTTSREFHTATLLPTGTVLVAGGEWTNGTVLTSSELFDEGRGALPAWTPTANVSNPVLAGGSAIAVTGTLLTGVSSASSDSFQSSASSFPVLQLHRLDNQASAWAFFGTFAANGTSATFSLPSTLTFGPYLAWANVNGVLSNGSVVFVGSNGASCMAGTGCSSGFCVSGFCCNSACGLCGDCSLTGSRGTCVISGTGTPGIAPTCSPYVCSGSAVTCPTSCASDANCAAGFWCNAASQCVAALANAGACVRGRMCSSGNCTDGVCCNSACAGDCNRCDLFGSVGTCTTAPLGNGGKNDTTGVTPACGAYVCNGTATACPTTCSTDANCAAGNYCSGTSCVPVLANASACTRGAMCTSGNCVDGACCASASCLGDCNRCDLGGGTCATAPAGNGGKSDTTGATPSCGAYLCNGTATACPTTCSTDANCAAGNYCSGTSCVPVLANAGACTRGAMCSSGNCVDGACCASASCPGDCNRCDLGGGTCATAAAGNGGKSDTTGATPSCGAYVCNGTAAACPTTCSSDANCAAGNYCLGTSCVPVLASGSACSRGAMCSTGNCVDGACCASASCPGDCNRCDLGGGTCAIASAGNGGKNDLTGATPSCGLYVCNGTAATCPTTCSTDANCAAGYYCSGTGCVPALANGSACTRAGMCSSGACADGVCCTSACAGDCNRCDLTASTGTCTVAPAGNGGKSDATGVTPSCGAYVCSGASTGCPSTCTADANCATGYFCNASGLCVPLLANGTACSRAAMCSSNVCADGFCCGSACPGDCNRCDLTGTTGTCTTAPAGNGGKSDTTGVTPSCGGYLCNGANATCPISCATDGNCAAGYYCSGTTCVASLANGAACARAAMCSSGNCVDGACCGSASCPGDCNRCDLGGGTCAIAPAGNGGKSDTTGTTPSCGAYVCSGSAASCPITCAADANCAAGFYCDATSHCSPTLAAGQSCSRSTMCTSGACADGVCCNSACAGACNRCDLVGFTGSCTVAPAGNGGKNDATGVSPACGGFVCDGTGTACPASCTSDANCAAGFWCNGAGACVAALGSGTACTRGPMCSSGFCADGVCCNSACPGECNRCDLTGSVGTCSTAPAGNGGKNDLTGVTPACSPYVCNGVSLVCPGSCSSDADCIAADWCDATGQCAAKAANGVACAAGHQCLSGFCADGFCCNSACAGGGCNRCDLAGKLGTCTLATSGDPGNPACVPYVCNGVSAACPTSCTGSANCVAGGYCNGTACVVQLAQGAACTANGQCQSGFCADGYCCNSACAGDCNRCDLTGTTGSCTTAPAGNGGKSDTTGVAPSCGAYVCNGTAATCPATCATDANCAGADYCSGTSCVPRLSAGAACTTANQCLSGFCADGVCCNSDCAGACDRCDLLGSVGTCTLAPAGNGGKDDVTGASPACGTFVCSGASPTCPSSCSSDSGCAAGNYCFSPAAGGICTAKIKAGFSCSVNGQCQTGFCADGLCCDSSCIGDCNRCDLAGSAGTCKLAPKGNGGKNDVTGAVPACGTLVCDGANISCPGSCLLDADCATGYFCSPSGQCAAKAVAGAACSTGNQCSTGFCADGVCCNVACTGDCARCDLSGSVGNCATAPLGNGGKSDSTGASPSCGAYLCDGTASICPTSCASKATCSFGNYCNASGACVPIQSNGATCTAGDQCQSGLCAQGRCCNAACTDSCSACNQAGKEGTCSPLSAGAAGNPSCTPYRCDGTALGCPTSCDVGTDCAAGSFCQNHICRSSNPAGSDCTAGDQCLSGVCADGVCCNDACAGACNRCDLATSKGTCALAPAGNGGRDDATGTAPACGLYQCDGTSAACPTRCSADQNCVAGYFCQDSSQQCAPALGNGSQCSRNAMCSSGFCVDGFCCNSACSDGSCDRCDVAGSEGRCTIAAKGDPGAPSCGAYLCDGKGAACPTACASASDCAPGVPCTDGHCGSGAADAGPAGGLTGWSCGCSSGGSGGSALALIGLIGLLRRRRRGAGAGAAVALAAALSLPSIGEAQTAPAPDAAAGTAGKAKAASAKKGAVPPVGAAAKKGTPPAGAAKKKGAPAAPAPAPEPAVVVTPEPPPPAPPPAPNVPKKKKDARPSVAVLNVEMTVTGESLDAAALTDFFIASIDEPGYLKVVGSKEISAILGFERQKALLGCGDSECMSNIAGALGVDLACFGSVGRVGDSYVVAGRLVDSNRGRVLGRSSVRTNGSNGILPALHQVAGELIGSYKASLSAPELERVTALAQPKPMPAMVRAESSVELIGLELRATGVMAYQPKAEAGLRGTVGATVELGYRLGFGLGFGVGAIISPYPGGRVTVDYRLVSSPVALDLAVRGGYWPSAKAMGGGAVVHAELPLGSYFGLTAEVAGEYYTAGPAQLAVLGGLGVAAHL